MTGPPDNSDASILMLADLHDEAGREDTAAQLREEVFAPQINGWHYEYRRFGGVSGVSGVSGGGGGGGVSGVSGVGGGVSGVSGVGGVGVVGI